MVRNAAIRAASGKFLAFLDSDDLWLPHKLERQLALMRATPARRWSYTQVRRIDDEGNDAASVGGRPWRALDGDIVEPLLRLEALIATPAVIAERELVLDAGGFDEQQRFCEDYDLWVRLAMRSGVAAFTDSSPSCACISTTTARIASALTKDGCGCTPNMAPAWTSGFAASAGNGARSVAWHSRRCIAAAGRTQLALRTFATSAADGWVNVLWWPRAARTLLGLLPTRPQAM